ncbi:mandelate racemase/muconate lactonizing enzyme family protein [Amycolatopsis sp. NPDC051372]|uniref:mandelate racemase/muconate lactonizing enzyme family protein n=1 Tax=Amycolatopsis sp. NPDC051372 TaxID=3155669 RepID=UPI003417F743
MTVKGINAHLHRFPLRPPWDDSRNHVTHLELIVCRLVADDGEEGTGVSYTGGHGGSAALAFLRDVLAPLVTTLDETRIEHVWQQMWHRAHDPGARGLAGIAMSAIDIALWDLAGKRAGAPLYRLLGGARDAIEAYGSGINLGLSTQELLDQVREWLDQGYPAVKVKVGKPSLTEDLDRLTAIRGLLGPDKPLMIDANQAWTAGEAVHRLQTLAEVSPFWIEEPVRSDDPYGHAHVRRSTGIPVATGENLHSKYEFADYVAKGAIDVVQADAIRLGGITEWIKVAHLAEAANTVVAPHFLLELSGSLACAVPNALYVEDVRGGSLTELGALAEPHPVIDGAWQPSDRPGHGLMLDEKALDRTRVA